jgi:peptidoglycan/xylan/chitin deacetylase (PgdA/CDA1 family)
MIYFTCDVHNLSLNMSYIKYSDKTELQATQLFLKLLEKYNVKATMFLTGKCFTEEWEDAKPICNHPLVEIGGHNYYCFRPAILHEFWNKTFDNFNGPFWLQYHDIKKTVKCIYAKTGKKIISWRNHMLFHGPNTEKILSKLNLSLCADAVKASATGPEWHEDGIYNFPMNIIPDYDHLYHADRTEEWVNRFRWGDDFGSDSYYIDEWSDIVLKQLQQKIDANVTVNMLVHPITMYICDKFANVERILQFVGSQQNRFYSELPLLKNDNAMREQS